MIYLGWFDAPKSASDTVEAEFEAKRLADGLFLFDTEAARSKLYHALKRALPEDTPLFVALLTDEAKFKGLADGSLKWLRSRTRG